MQDARETDERRRTYKVRWSEAVERNEADGPFSTVCKGCPPSLLLVNRLSYKVLSI